MEQSRRDFLKKSAIVGGAAWVAPSVVSVSSASATAVVSAACVGCVKSAFGISATGLVAIAASGVAGSGNECVASINPTSVGGVSITASAVCGHTSSTSCEAQACVANVVISLPTTPTATSITVNSLQTCVSEAGATACTQCAAVDGLVTINGTAIPGPFTCNQALLPTGLSALVAITANQQTCNTDGSRTVDGLVITLLSAAAPPLETITLASATAGGCSGCTCTACASCTTCLQCGTTCTQGQCTA